MGAAATPQPVKPEVDSPQAVALTTITKQFSTLIEVTTRIAEKGPSVFLPAFGSSLIIAAFAMKLKILGNTVSNLSPAEFITVMLIASILIAGGACIRFYQYLLLQRASKQISNQVFAIAQKGIETGAELGSGKGLPSL